MNGYNDLVDLTAILRELDAEIEKLNRVRKIIAGLEQPVRSRKKKPSHKRLSSPAAAAADPLLIKLPPKLKPDRPRVKSVAQTPIALAPASSDRPVFVPRGTLPLPKEQSPKSADFNPQPLSSPVEDDAEPLLVRLSPKVKREYRPRVKSVAQTPIALAPASSDRPVFVPRAALPPPKEQSPKSADFNPELLEASFRKNLLSGAV